MLPHHPHSVDGQTILVQPSEQEAIPFGRLYVPIRHGPASPSKFIVRYINRSFSLGLMRQVRLINHRLKLHHLESSLDFSFERSLDSSSLSARPSRKRCRSPTTLVPSSTPILRSIAPTHAHLLPLRKRFIIVIELELILRNGIGIGSIPLVTVEVPLEDYWSLNCSKIVGGWLVDG
ncbi:hypothetical protein Tco_0643896 [Tanacetum coccineum]